MLQWPTSIHGCCRSAQSHPVPLFFAATMPRPRRGHHSLCQVPVACSRPFAMRCATGSTAALPLPAMATATAATTVAAATATQRMCARVCECARLRHGAGDPALMSGVHQVSTFIIVSSPSTSAHGRRAERASGSKPVMYLRCHSCRDTGGARACRACRSGSASVCGRACW